MIKPLVILHGELFCCLQTLFTTLSIIHQKRYFLTKSEKVAAMCFHSWSSILGFPKMIFKYFYMALLLLCCPYRGRKKQWFWVKSAHFPSEQIYFHSSSSKRSSNLWLIYLVGVVAVLFCFGLFSAFPGLLCWASFNLRESGVQLAARSSKIMKEIHCWRFLSWSF